MVRPKNHTVNPGETIFRLGGDGTQFRSPLVAEIRGNRKRLSDQRFDASQLLRLVEAGEGVVHVEKLRLGETEESGQHPLDRPLDHQIVIPYQPHVPAAGVTAAYAQVAQHSDVDLVPIVTELGMACEPRNHLAGIVRGRVVTHHYFHHVLIRPRPLEEEGQAKGQPRSPIVSRHGDRQEGYSERSRRDRK